MNKATSRRVLIIAIVVLVLLGLATFKMIYQFYSNQKPGLDRVSAMCGVGFPSSSELIGSYYTICGRELYAKVGMSKVDAERWIAELAKTGDVSTTERIDQLPYELSALDLVWWKLGEPRKYTAVYVRREGHSATRMLFVWNTGEYAQVYIGKT